MLDVETFEHGDERRHVVAAVGIVRVDARDLGELAFPMLDREQRGHHGLAFVVGRTEEIFRIRNCLVDAILRGPVPINGECACFLDHRPERKTHAGRNDALHAVDLLLLHELAEPLDRVLGRRLVLDDQFDLAAADSVLGVVLFNRPLRGADAVLARSCGNPRAWRQDADAQRLILRDRGCEDASGGRDGAECCGGCKKPAARNCH